VLRDYDVGGRRCKERRNRQFEHGSQGKELDPGLTSSAVESCRDDEFFQFPSKPSLNTWSITVIEPVLVSPVPPLVDVIALVALVCKPSSTPVTSTVNEHGSDSCKPETLMLFDPGIAVNVPPLG